jgi:hypothetical protein
VHGGGGGCFCNFSYIFQYCTNKILMLQKYQFDVHCNILYGFFSNTQESCVSLY